VGFSDLFGKKVPEPPSPCPKCGAEMDPDEVLCPQCDYRREAAGQKPRSAQAAPPPQLKIDWSASPAARRLAMRASALATTNWWRRLFGARPPQPAPPAPRRVAARALALAAVVARAFAEMRPDSSGNREARDSPLAWLRGLGIASELEPQERAFLQAPLGRVERQTVINAAWRAEGLVVLAWALGRCELPAYDQPVPFPPQQAQEAVGLAAPDVARELLASAALRPATEIDRFATHITVVGWRLRQFGMVPVPMDYAGYLRGHGLFKETWLAGLRLVDGDLAVGAHAIADAPAEVVVRCRDAVDERRRAAYWLQGDDPVYSKVDPATVLSAC
jgi:hypothetical protein